MEEDRLKYSIDRFDHYFDSVNNKSAVYIAINTFITGGIIALITQTDTLNGYSNFDKYSLSGALFVGILNLIILAVISIPYVSNKPKSLYYFGSISKMKKIDFLKMSEDYSKKENLKDLRAQTFLLSRGLTAKFNKLKIVGLLLIAQFILLIPAILFLINKT